MALYSFRLYCQRIDHTRNMARYYALSIQPTLFGEAAVVRCWGRIGKRGGEKSEVFASEMDAAVHFLELARRKRAKGYKPVGNCGNPPRSPTFSALRPRQRVERLAEIPDQP
ncbi:putative DNA-binding WGR domain protein [Rhizobium sp. BK591]|uniref:WGR domain-containing protein n=1 Tax=Rhizobium sp. BK591 TaxID=2586985 RepID=UPI001050D26A|nr:WGR domain-containing protein [Rhizobium sp. BK591]MBB3747013.1 putative DNA-binding WGR domain protein [Rhizobium sp. BK591]